MGMPSLEPDLLFPFVFLYVGPETILPLTSIIGAILGGALIFWRLIIKWFKKFLSLFRKKTFKD